MGIWWASLSVLQQIFYIIAISSSCVLVVQIILNLIGLAGGDFDLDGIPDVLEGLDDMDGLDGDAGLSLFSVRTILAFLVGFGWGGVLAVSWDIAPFFAVLFACVAGCVFMGTVFWLMRQMTRLTASGNIQVANAVGLQGTVYLTIPPQEQGQGQIQIKIQGRLREYPALTDVATVLHNGSCVQVIKVVGEDTLFVRPCEDGVPEK